MLARHRAEQLEANDEESSACPSNRWYFSPRLQLPDGSWLCCSSDGYRLHSALLLQGSAGSAAYLQPGQGQQDQVWTARIFVSSVDRAISLLSVSVFWFFWLKKRFCWRGTKLAVMRRKKGKEGRRDKLIITAFQLGMWRCCCLSPHTFPSFMPPSIFCPPASLIVPNSPPLSLLLLSVGVQQPYKSGLAP